MQLTEEEKLRTLRQLSDIFSDLPYEWIQNVCEQQYWNVGDCIGHICNGGETKYADTKCCPSKFESVHGAIPKSSGSKRQENTSSHKKIIRTFKDGETSNIGSNFSSGEYKIVQQILAGHKVMIIMRGAPGSGKSYLANCILQKCLPLGIGGYNYHDFVLSTDDFFYDLIGHYKYRVDQLDEAHAFNQRQVHEKAATGWSPIIVDNTNMKLWEMLPYVQTAIKYGYVVELLEPNTPWRYSVGKLAVKNQHRVSYEKIKSMLDKYEEGSVSDLMKMLKQTRYVVPLPQMRKIPPPAPDLQTNENFQKFRNTEVKNPCFKELPSLLLEESKPQYLCNIYKTSGPKVQRKNVKTLIGSKTGIIDHNISMDDKLLYPSFVTNRLKLQDMEPSNASDGIEKTIVDVLELTTKHKEESVTNIEETSSVRREKTLLELLREDSDAVPIPTMVVDEKEVDLLEDCRFKRHKVNCCNENKSFATLRQIYPNKNVDGLWDLFIKCDGNIDWAVDILLKENELIMDDRDYIKSINKSQDTFFCNCNKEIALRPMDTIVNSIGNTIKPQRQRIHSLRSNQRSKIVLKEVKESIEARVMLSNENYSNHIRHIRDFQKGILNSSTKTYSNAETQTYFIDEGQENYEDEIIQVSLNESLIQQLRSIFMSEITFDDQLSEKLTKNVFMPRKLGKELYILWMESAYNEIEEQRQQGLQEDEQFARLLKNPKYQNSRKSPCNIQELLDKNMTWRIYNSEENNQQQNNLDDHPVDLALQLTRLKLYEIFPNIPRETLLDIFATHNNRYHETVEALRYTINPNEALGKITQNHLLKKFKVLHENGLLSLHPDSIDSNDSAECGSNTPSLSSEEKKRLALCNFEEARNLAAHHSQLKSECFQKARDVIQKGNTAVAVYYSEIASLHKKKADNYNNQAASYMMEVHKYAQKNSDLLDLHYLHALEAVGCLDLFLDRHIYSLRKGLRSYKNIFVITGRGLHSVGGISTIKTKVKSRLKERNLKWSEVNPGLLKIKIFSASRQSSNI